MKKLLTMVIATTVGFGLAGCAGVSTKELLSPSYKAGTIFGGAISQDNLDLLANGDIKAFCKEYAGIAGEQSVEYFSVDDFESGCVDGFNEANGS
ncbi:unannotated protein [freshwater metagenome]|uniref:Unannotated protein n=1 Tax=freshwater metagenome TaxID=449393 RepID=A0A6J6GS78_9ZZZZ